MVKCYSLDGNINQLHTNNKYDEKQYEQEYQTILRNLRLMLDEVSLQGVDHRRFTDREYDYKNCYMHSQLAGLCDVTEPYKVNRDFSEHASGKVILYVGGAIMILGFMGFYKMTHKIAFQLFSNIILRAVFTIIPCAVLAALLASSGGRSMQKVNAWWLNHIDHDAPLPILFQLFPRLYPVVVVAEVALAWFSSNAIEQVTRENIQGEWLPYLVVCAAISAKVFGLYILYGYIGSLMKGSIYASKSGEAYERVKLEMGACKAYSNIKNLDPVIVRVAVSALPPSNREQLLLQAAPSIDCSSCLFGARQASDNAYVNACVQVDSDKMLQCNGDRDPFSL